MEAQELGKQLWKCNVGKKGLKLSTVTARRKKKKAYSVDFQFLVLYWGEKKNKTYTCFIESLKRKSK